MPASTQMSKAKCLRDIFKDQSWPAHFVVRTTKTTHVVTAYLSDMRDLEARNKLEEAIKRLKPNTIRWLENSCGYGAVNSFKVVITWPASES